MLLPLSVRACKGLLLISVPLPPVPLRKQEGDGHWDRVMFNGLPWDMDIELITRNNKLHEGGGEYFIINVYIPSAWRGC